MTYATRRPSTISSLGSASVTNANLRRGSKATATLRTTAQFQNLAPFPEQIYYQFGVVDRRFPRSDRLRVHLAELPRSSAHSARELETPRGSGLHDHVPGHCAAGTYDITLSRFRQISPSEPKGTSTTTSTPTQSASRHSAERAPRSRGGRVPPCPRASCLGGRNSRAKARSGMRGLLAPPDDAEDDCTGGTLERDHRLSD